MKVYQLLADALVAQGVDTVFGLLGDANMFLVSDLVARHGVRFVAARNENAAVMMADGYARATGRCPVATVTQGPGLAVAGAALTIARQARTPLVLVAGDTPPGDPGHVQSFPQQPFALATAGEMVPVVAAANVARDVATAFRLARSAGGPVVLNVPIDLQDQDVADDVPAPVAVVVTRRPGRRRRTRTTWRCSPRCCRRPNGRWCSPVGARRRPRRRYGTWRIAAGRCWPPR